VQGNDRRLKSQMSISTDANGHKLDGDSESPGNSKYYGTNASGTKGWFDLMSGGGKLINYASLNGVTSQTLTIQNTYYDFSISSLTSVSAFGSDVTINTTTGAITNNTGTTIRLIALSVFDDVHRSAGGSGTDRIEFLWHIGATGQDSLSSVDAASSNTHRTGMNIQYIELANGETAKIQYRNTEAGSVTIDAFWQCFIAQLSA